MNSKIVIYGVGGAGIKLAHKFSQIDVPNTPAFGKPHIYYQDTGNTTANHLCIDDPYYYMGDTTVGGGGVRQNAAPVVLQKIQHALATQPPGSYNIILHSMTGASGSVIGPVLAGELASKGHCVISLMTRNDLSQNALYNSKSCIATYDGVSDKKKVPLLTRIYDKSAKINDADIINDLSWLMMLFSENHRGLDSNDIKTWMKQGSQSNPLSNRAWLVDISAGMSLGHSLSVLGLATDETICPEGGPIGFMKVGVPHSSATEPQIGRAVITEEKPVWFSIRGSTHQYLQQHTSAADEAALEVSKVYDTSEPVKGSSEGGLVF